ncbi:unnamed protein product, partial [Mesorhabditis spiculigera]
MPQKGIHVMPADSHPYRREMRTGNWALSEGKWTDTVDISRCFNDQTTVTNLVVEVRDQGTGKKGSAQIRVGDTISINLPSNWTQQCNVVRLKWYRILNNGVKSRERVLMIPNVDATAGSSGLNFTLLSPANYSAVYSVGQTVAIKTNIDLDDDSYNYVVVCNGNELSRSAKVDPLTFITFVVSRRMLGQCVLYLYSVRTRQVDMLMFFVNDQCSGIYTTPSKSEVKPGQSITMTLNGKPKGYAIVRTLDEKIAKIMEEEQKPLPKLWEGLFFARNYQVEEQLRIFNLIKNKAIKEAIIHNCATAGPYFKNSDLGGQCPQGKASTSAVSDLCMQQITTNCRSNITLQRVCDRNANCRNIKVPDARKPGKIKTTAVLKTRPLPYMDDFEHVPPILPSDEVAFTRSYFPHVWIFDSFYLGNTGMTAVTRDAPHSVDMPKNVYVNESITVKVTATGTNLDQEHKLSVCHSDLPRQVCADMGQEGTHGQPAYSRIILNKENPVAIKTFNMRFFKTGEVKLTFMLRTELFMPGEVSRCDNGEVLDIIEHKMMVAKRAETEEHYRRLILSVEKPVSAALNDALNELRTDEEPIRHVFEINEYRLPHENAMVADVKCHLPDTTAVHSVAIEISRFLPTTITQIEYSNELPTIESARRKRGIVDYGNAFLSDAVKRLSVELYKFKLLKTVYRQDDAVTSSLENSIGALIADMLRFSDCNGQESCGYSEYGRPVSPVDRSPVLTAISTSLLCEAMADENLVCGGLRYLHSVMLGDFAENESNNFINFNGMADINPRDRSWFLRGLLLHISSDCAAYTCVKNDTAWSRLYEYFYDFEEGDLTDTRTKAALAYLATNATNNVLRQTLNASIREGVFPYWTAGERNVNTPDRLQNGHQEFFNLKGVKSGDVLANALGILAFVGRGVVVPSILEFDALADWIYEQKKDDETYENALDTYFASRALFEYRLRKVAIPQLNENPVLEVYSRDIGRKVYNVTDVPLLVYLPNKIRNFTITTRGFGKVKTGIRILADKRQRNRRQLTDSLYPLKITVEQQKQSRDILLQTVCISTFSPLIRTFEVVHGLFTGFSTYTDKIQINPEHELQILNPPTISSYAVHMVVFLNQTHVPACYSVAQFPPSYAHEPDSLAPVEMSCRHPVNDIVGQTLISHPDARNFQRKKRSSALAVHLHHKASKRRTIRSAIDETIESVCFTGDQCLCTESTCVVNCNSCGRSTQLTVKKELCKQGAFGLFGELTEKRHETVASGSQHVAYTVYKMKVLKKLVREERQLQLKDNVINVWLRDCNIGCLKSTDLQKGETYFLIGDIADVAVDSDAAAHYILRLNDHFEKSAEKCMHYQNIFWSGPFDYRKCGATRR